MNPTQKLEEVVTRLTPEQYEHLLAYAESLAAQTAAPDVDEMSILKKRLKQNFPEHLRQRLRELTHKSEGESLSEAERKEYVELAKQLEMADAERLEAASKLSASSGMSLKQTLEELDSGVN